MRLHVRCVGGGVKAAKSAAKTVPYAARRGDYRAESAYMVGRRRRL